MSTVTPARSIVTIADGDLRRGAVAAVAAYAIWGFFPLLFHFLEGADPALIVAHRVVWSMLLVAAILYFGGRWSEVKAVLASRATLVRILFSAIVLAFNWLIYVWAVEQNRVLETSFGYFLNPLVNVALGMLLLGERQNRWQWVAIAIAVVAMAIQAVGMSGIPWVALALAVSFAVYSYARKTVSASSATGLFVETLVLLPVALGFIGWTVATAGPGPHADPRLMALLVFTGPATSFTLLLFAFAVQRLRLTTMGIVQYIAPSIQFVLAIVFFGEELNLTRFASFVLIWVSLAVFTADSLRRRPRARPELAKT